MLFSRPLDEYTRLFAERGLLISKSGRVLTVDGPLSAGEFTVGAKISSQFLTGLLLSLPSADGDSVIRVEPPLNSGGYIDLTLSVLESFDVFVHREDEYTFTVPGNQRFMHGEYTAEGDWSGAAYILAMNYLGGSCRVRGLSASSRQPDSAAEDIFTRVAAADGKPIDLSATPDLAPIAIALAAYRGGAHFTGTGRLCHKESNRAMAMKDELARLGCDIEIGEDSITVPPSVLQAPTEPIQSHNDHRIAMAMAVLLTRLGGEIDGAECVKKSYPDFFRHLTELGVDVKEIG
jgi:3-phosphoshikimate 1-carboxyvinyltransferase